jgi:ribosomal protein S18 acetylase RimI-like enzyme
VISDLAIRLARRADAAAIAAMSRDDIERGLPWSWTEARVERAILDPEVNVAVAGDAGALIAFGIMSYRDATAHLLLFSVRKSHRRQGVGSAILRWLEEVARAAGIQSIQLECRRNNDAARNFYAEQGYHEQVIAKGYYRGIEDAVRLEKWLVVKSAD